MSNLLFWPDYYLFFLCLLYHREKNSIQQLVLKQRIALPSAMSARSASDCHGESLRSYGNHGSTASRRAKINKTEHVRQLVSAMQLADIGWQRQVHNFRGKEQSVLCIINHPRITPVLCFVVVVVVVVVVFLGGVRKTSFHGIKCFSPSRLTGKIVNIPWEIFLAIFWDPCINLTNPTIEWFKKLKLTQGSYLLSPCVNQFLSSCPSSLPLAYHVIDKLHAATDIWQETKLRQKKV